MPDSKNYDMQYWCIVGGANLIGYDCLPLAIAFIESELKKEEV
jgi:hypothetical protein